MILKYRELFKNRNYIKLFWADMINRFGDSIDSIALTWIVYTVTGSASWSALIFTVNRLPSILIQPLAGAYVEKKNKKPIMVMTDLLRALLVGYLATRLIFGQLNRWDILIVTLLISTVEAFRQPASMALIPLILSYDELENGLALENSASRIIELIGLSLAGIIIAAFGATLAVYLDMVTFLISGLILMTLKLNSPAVPAGEHPKEERLFKTFLEGLKVVAGNAKIKSILFLAVFLNGLLTPFNSLQAPLVSEVLHSDELMLSIISVGITGGMIIGSVLYPAVRDRFKPKTLIMAASYSLSLPFIGSCLVGYYLTDPLTIQVIMTLIFVVFGILIAMLNMYTSVMIIKSCEQQYMARIGALVGAFCIGITPLVSMVISVLTNFVSTFHIFLFTGFLNIAVVFFLLRRKEYD